MKRNVLICVFAQKVWMLGKYEDGPEASLDVYSYTYDDTAAGNDGRTYTRVLLPNVLLGITQKT